MGQTNNQANGSLEPGSSDARLQELLRQNQELQHRLAEADRENGRLQSDLEKMKESHDNYRDLVTAMTKEEFPPEFWANLSLEDGIPVEDLLKEFELEQNDVPV